MTDSRPLRRLATVVAVVIYALVFGEMFLRILHPQALVPRYVSGGADGIRANVPGARFFQHTPETDVEIRYNSAGMRDDRPPPPLARAPGECRVALLGDSYFTGFESSWQDSFAMQLEKALAVSGHRCRVLNFAVSGFGQGEMLVALHSRVAPYRPDVVIVSLHVSDGMDNIRSGLFKRGADGEIEPLARSYLPGVAMADRLRRITAYRWMEENSHLYAAVREWAGRKGKALLAALSGAAAVAAPAETGPPAFYGDQNLNAALLHALDRDTRVMGTRLLLLEVPGYQDRTRFLEVAENLAGADTLARIPWATPLPVFNSYAAPDVKIYMEHGHLHWTPLGNRLAAEATASALIDQRLLPGTTTPLDTRTPAP